MATLTKKFPFYIKQHSQARLKKHFSDLKPHLEELEQRRVLAVDLMLDAGLIAEQTDGSCSGVESGSTESQIAEADYAIGPIANPVNDRTDVPDLEDDGLFVVGAADPGTFTTELEPNDSTGSATPINVPAIPELVTGTISSALDEDYFSFTLASDAGVFFDIDAQENGLSTLDAEIDVFDSGGVFILGNDDGFDFDGFALNDTTQTPSSEDSSLYLDLTAGSYFVRVSSIGATFGDYELKVFSDTNYTTTIPVLNSNLGASHTLYLDFDGHSSTTDDWTERDIDPDEEVETLNGPYTIDRFDFDGVPGTLNPAEQMMIHNIWRMVSEDYSPYDLNVTTVNPGSFGDSSAYRLVYGGDGSEVGSAGSIGLAFVGSYDSGGEDNQVGFVFTENFDYLGTASSTEIMAQALEMGNTSAHEFGHALDLLHYGGGNPKLGGIMHTADFGLNRERWQAGDTHDGEPPVSSQDDMAQIDSQLGYRSDDYGDNTGSATILVDLGDRTYLADGILHNPSDTDFFQFFASGAVIIDTVVDQYVADVDTELHLYDSLGTPITSDDPGGILSAQIQQRLAAGNYFIEVRSDGGDGEAGQFQLDIANGIDLGGRVWDDINGDGIQDVGEPGQVGTTVNLFDPVDGVIGNGDDVQLDTTITDSAGDYMFNVIEGDHYVEFIEPIETSISPKDEGSDDTLDSDADRITGRTDIISVTLSGIYDDIDAA